MCIVPSRLNPAKYLKSCLNEDDKIKPNGKLDPARCKYFCNLLNKKVTTVGGDIYNAPIRYVYPVPMTHLV